MFHRLQIRENLLADLRVPGKPRLEQLMLRAGETIEAQVRSYVRETDEGPVECADLFLNADLFLTSGETLLDVRMEFFRFI
jgi:hypothetical protein